MSLVDNYNNNSRYYYKNGNVYEKRSPYAADIGYIAATIATGLVYKALPSFSNPFIKQIQKEWANNHIYENAFKNAVKISGLEKKGLRIVEEIDPITDIGKGLNACFKPSEKIIKLNTNKASITGFHELGHAMNNMKTGVGKVLQKLRGPGYYIAGLMGTIALFSSRNKTDDDNKNIVDKIQDNCGKIAFAGMLPTVLEEGLASYKGIELAKKANLGKSAINNLKKFYGKALLSYIGYALITGISVFISSKIMEKFTKPKKIEI